MIVENILSVEAKLFLNLLRNNFELEIKRLLKKRHERKSNQWCHSTPDFLEQTQDIRDEKLLKEIINNRTFW